MINTQEPSGKPGHAPVVAAGGFSVAKVVENPDGLTGLPGSFTVEYWIDGVAQSPALSIAADGTVSGAITAAAGAVVELGEVTPAVVPGGSWSAPSCVLTGATAIPPMQPGAQTAFEVADGVTVAAVVTNTVSATVVAAGGFSVAKVLDGLVPGDFVAGAGFEVEYFLDGSSTAAGSVTVLADGTVAGGPQDLPVGTVVTFGEVAPTNTPVGFDWGGVVFAPASVTITVDGHDTLVTVTNTYAPAAPGPGLGGFRMAKLITGDAAGRVVPGTTFTVDYFLDGATAPSGTLQLPADGSSVVVTGVKVGTTVTFRERTPVVIDGTDWGAPEFSPESIVISESVIEVTVTNTLTESDTPGDGDGELPVTGVEIVRLLAVAVALMATGLVVVLAVRVRRT